MSAIDRSSTPRISVFTSEAVNASSSHTLLLKVSEIYIRLPSRTSSEDTSTPLSVTDLVILSLSGLKLVSEDDLMGASVALLRTDCTLFMRLFQLLVKCYKNATFFSLFFPVYVLLYFIWHSTDLHLVTFSGQTVAI